MKEKVELVKRRNDKRSWGQIILQRVNVQGKKYKIKCTEEGKKKKNKREERGATREDIEREVTRVGRVTWHANIGFSHTFGPSALETFIRYFILAVRIGYDLGEKTRGMARSEESYVYTTLYTPKNLPTYGKVNLRR